MQVNKAYEDAEKLAHLGHWTWDMLTNSVLWSDETYRIFGEIPQSFLPTFERFMSYISPENQLKMQDSISLVIESNDSYQFNYFIEFRLFLKSTLLIAPVTEGIEMDIC